MNRIHSREGLVARAERVLPASRVWQLRCIACHHRGEGARVQNADGNEKIDCPIGSRPMLLGHGHPEVSEAVFEQRSPGMTFFANNDRASELAEAICDALPCCAQVRFVAVGR